VGCPMAAVPPIAAGWAPGDFIFVHYEADPELYHERMLLAEITPLRWVVATPDADVYPMDLSTPPLLGVRSCPPGGDRHLPVGFMARDCYRFEHGEMGVPTQAVRNMLIADGTALARQLRAAAGVGEHVAPPPLGPPEDPGGPPPPPLEAGVPPPIVGAPPPAQVVEPANDGFPWVVDEYVTGHELGDIVRLPPDAAVRGRRALAFFHGPHPIVLWHLDASETIDEFKERRGRELSGDDARTLPVRYSRDGRRHRDFQEAVEMLDPVEMADFPLSGPRTTHWALTAMAASTVGPMARHHRWVAEARIPSTDRSVYEHEVLSRFIELALCYDGLAIDNLASAELLVRRLQLIEHSHIDDPSSPNWEGARHFMGTGERRGGALVAPALEQFVAENLRGEAAIAKERRKARESRTMPGHRGDQGGRGGGSGGGRGAGQGRGQGRGGSQAAGAAATS